MAVHNHGPDEGRGLDKFEGIKVPVKHDGVVIGKAEISLDGEIINAELDTGLMPEILRYALMLNLADSISIRPNYIPAVPAHNKEN